MRHAHALRIRDEVQVLEAEAWVCDGFMQRVRQPLAFHIIVIATLCHGIAAFRLHATPPIP